MPTYQIETYSSYGDDKAVVVSEVRLTICQYFGSQKPL